MILLHHIGDRPYPVYTAPEIIEKIDEPISFDGVYKSVYEHRELLRNKQVILFITGAYVGGNNAWDNGAPLYEEFCDWNEIMTLVNMGCKFGWHTWSHKDLTKLDYNTLLYEVTPPFPMEVFAYPYGIFNEQVIQAVKEAGFKKAYTVYDGDDSDYQRTRRMI